MTELKNNTETPNLLKPVLCDVVFSTKSPQMNKDKPVIRTRVKTDMRYVIDYGFGQRGFGTYFYSSATGKVIFFFKDNG